jgi:hypothetical protein
MSLFDDLVSFNEESGRYFEAKRFSSLEIDDEFKFDGLLDRQVRWFCPFEYLIDVMSALPPKADIPESDWHVRFYQLRFIGGVDEPPNTPRQWFGQRSNRAWIRRRKTSIASPRQNQPRCRRQRSLRQLISLSADLLF